LPSITATDTGAIPGGYIEACWRLYIGLYDSWRYHRSSFRIPAVYDTSWKSPRRRLVWMANCCLQRHSRVFHLSIVGLGIDYQWMTSVAVNEARTWMPRNRRQQL